MYVLNIKIEVDSDNITDFFGNNASILELSKKNRLSVDEQSVLYQIPLIISYKRYFHSEVTKQ